MVGSCYKCQELPYVHIECRVLKEVLEGSSDCLIHFHFTLEKFLSTYFPVNQGSHKHFFYYGWVYKHTVAFP